MDHSLSTRRGRLEDFTAELIHTEKNLFPFFSSGENTVSSGRLRSHRREKSDFTLQIWICSDSVNMKNQVDCDIFYSDCNYFSVCSWMWFTSVVVSSLRIPVLSLGPGFDQNQDLMFTCNMRNLVLPTNMIVTEYRRLAEEACHFYEFVSFPGSCSVTCFHCFFVLSLILQNFV